MNDYFIKSALAVVLITSLSSPAYAYLDGATGSMILQALIGGTATAMFFGRMYLAKAKTLIFGGAHKTKEAGESE